jgi:anti-sigma B factor antagonist
MGRYRRPAGAVRAIHRTKDRSMTEPTLPRVSPQEPPVVSLSGEVDLAVAVGLQESLDQLLASGASTIVVDLLDATFLDSIALGVLVTTLEECRSKGGDLPLLVADPRILKVLEITGLVDTFTIFSDPSSAQRSVAS